MKTKLEAKKDVKMALLIWIYCMHNGGLGKKSGYL